MNANPALNDTPPFAGAAGFATDLFLLLAANINSRHLDNSRAYYHLRSTKAQADDEAFLEQEQNSDLIRLIEEKRDVITEEIEIKSYLYERLEDARSRMLLVELAAYAILGHQRMRLSYHQPDNVTRREELVRLTDRPDEADADLLEHIRKEWKSDYSSLFDMSVKDIPIRLYTHSEEIFRLCNAPTYSCLTKNGKIYPKLGDVCLDCGASFGDISLEFAHAVGESGRIITFEPYEEVLPVLRRNLEMNPELSKRITHVERAVSDEDETTIAFLGWGGGSRLDPDGSKGGTYEVKTIRIDTAAKELDLPRVDFLKMDIEGAEIHALRGAENTIRRYKPRLAICVYHNERTDFLHITRWLDELGLGYKFWLNHHAVNFWDTVLYAEI